MLIYPVFGNSNGLTEELHKIGCSESSISIFIKKMDTVPIKITGVKTVLANIIKQEMISCKGDAAVHTQSISCGIDATDILLLGSPSIYENFTLKMEFQNSPTLSEIGNKIKEMLSLMNKNKNILVTGNNKTLDYSKPLIMGILNITGDSFYDGGKYTDRNAALERCGQMISEGAEIIDIGGESTRPGANPVPENEELDRVIPLVEEINKNFKTLISVDTYKSRVAEEALKAGADIVNDISAFGLDPEMAEIVKKYDSIAVLMHMKGTPGNMQVNPVYTDVLQDLVSFFDERLSFVKSKNISFDRIIIDPGIGFGKRLIDNRNILRNLSSFKKYGLPVLVGASRKSSIGMILNDTDDPKKAAAVEDRLYGTLGAHAYACLHGANIIRVHDVKQHFEMLKVLNAVK